MSSARFLRYTKFERAAWLDMDIDKRIYAYRHRGFYYEPAENYYGLIIVGYYREAEESAVEVVNDGRTERRVLTVPAEVDGVPVIAVGKHAFTFMGADELILPESLKFICSEAFFSCSFDRIVIPGRTIFDSGAFAGCKGLMKLITSRETTILNRQARAQLPRLADIEPRSRFKKKQKNDPPDRPMQERNKIIDPEYLLIAEHKYRADDVLSVTLYLGWKNGDTIWRSPYWELRPEDNEKAGRLLEKQSGLLKKYLGCGLEKKETETQGITYHLYVDPELANKLGYIHFRRCSEDPASYFSHDVKAASSDLPALVHACNEMISEYMSWCEENGEDVYDMLVLPCGRTPYYYHVPSPCDNCETPLRTLLIPDRLLDEWNTIDDRRLRGEFQTRLRELQDIGDIIITAVPGPKGFDRFNNKPTAYNANILGLAGVKMYFSDDDILKPNIYHINDSMFAGETNTLPFVDSYPSTLNNFCDMPPEIINEILKICIPEIEKVSGVHREKYRICGSYKLTDDAGEYIYHRRHGYTPDAYQARSGMVQYSSIYSSEGKHYIDEGSFTAADVYLKEDGNWDVSGIVSYSERQRAMEDRYCAERYGWKI